MALQACSECSKEISDKASACPHCGAPVISAKKTPPHVPIWAYVVSGLLGGWLMVSCAGSKESGKNAASSGLAEGTALLMCQTALQRAARDPENASIPYVKDQGRGDEYYFAWGAGTKPARMRNGMGNEVATSASCIVSKSQKQITSLTLDGQTLR